MLSVNLQNIQATQATAENIWQTLQSLPEPLSGPAVTAGHKIYLLSAFDLFEYDTQTQSLTKKATMPTPRTDCGLAVVGYKIYTMGGRGTGPTNVNEVYDTITGMWETKQSTIDYSLSQLIANTVNGKIYAIYAGGRYNGSTMIDTGSNIDVYDPETDNWTRISALHQEVPYLRASCAIDDKIYVIEDNTAATTIGEGKLHIYDTTTDAWSTGATLPTFYKNSRMVATTGEHAPKQIYLVGGAIIQGIGDFEGVNTTFSYDPISDCWSRAADMPTARQRAGVAFVDDKIYAIGGETGPGVSILDATPTSAVEVYTPFGYVTIQPSASPSNGPESSQPVLPEATAVIAGAAIAGIAIAATAILVYRHKHLKTAKQNKPN